MADGNENEAKDEVVADFQGMTELSNSSSLVGLDVGGKKFRTTVGTLTQHAPDSMLAAMFSGRHPLCKDKDGNFFIDRDGEHFRHILNWLRDGEIPKLEDSQYAELANEARYYMLTGLADGILDVLSKEDTASDPGFTRTDIIKYRHSQKSCTCSSNKNDFQGVKLSGLDLSKLDLSKINFSSACLRNVSFSGANLQSANFNHVDAEGATFDDANLCNSTFVGANLQCANFNHVDAKDATFDYANLCGSTFDGAIIQGASFVGAKGADLYLANSLF